MLDDSNLPKPNVYVRYKQYTVSKVHANVSSYLYPKFRRYDLTTISYGNINKYRVAKPIGAGKFSVVFLGTDGKHRIVIKTYKNVSQTVIKREVFLLRACKNIPNIIKLLDVVKDYKTNTTSLVMEYCNGASHKSRMFEFTLSELRFYLYNLLQALADLHSRGIMHRDIKPDNIIFDMKTGKFKLLDLGLAELYFPRQQYTTGIGTLKWMAPELVFDYKMYDYGVDIWATGIIALDCMMGYNVTETEDLIGMVKIQSKLFTPAAILIYSEHMGFPISGGVLSHMSQMNCDNFSLLLNKARPGLGDPVLIDLVKKMLVVDHTQRITARDALAHPFFDPMRSK